MHILITYGQIIILMSSLNFSTIEPVMENLFYLSTAKENPSQNEITEEIFLIKSDYQNDHQMVFSGIIIPHSITTDYQFYSRLFWKTDYG